MRRAAAFGGRPTGRPYSALLGMAGFAFLVAGCGKDSPPTPAPVAPPPAIVAPPPSPAAPAAPPPAPHMVGTLLKVGSPAPDFRVKDDAGRERTLAEFRGHRVVLWFFPKALTGG